MHVIPGASDSSVRAKRRNNYEIKIMNAPDNMVKYLGVLLKRGTENGTEWKTE